MDAHSIVSRQTLPFFDGDCVVGREYDRIAILSMIFTPSDEALSVLPIVGMGGVGKTVMAQLVYNSQEIREHFDKRIWISVPEGTRTTYMDIFRLMLKELGGVTRNRFSMEDLEDLGVTRDSFSMEGLEEMLRVVTRDRLTRDRFWLEDLEYLGVIRDSSSMKDLEVIFQVRKIIHAKKYFLVLDDVWLEDSTLWKGFFSELLKLSKVTKNWCLVTTRSTKVAQVVSQRPAHSLTLLSEDECWRIISRSAGIEDDQELLPIKSQLVSSCGGLPLAAVVVAKFLRSLRKEDWPQIVSRLSGDNNDIISSLDLSYKPLPAPIRKCFAFTSVFDADDVIEKDLLIELWMAQGLLHKEKTGVKYFNTLVQVSLLQEMRGGRFYRMHPFVLYLARSVSSLKHISSNEGLRPLTDIVRHLTVRTSGGTMMYTDTSACIIFQGSSSYEEQYLVLRFLYALNLSKVDMTELPNSIGTLGLLRFLNLSTSKITCLPETLCDLTNLQTLRMVDCLHLLGFPKRMSDLVSLRHLHYFSDDERFQMPLLFRRLVSLQTLEFFNVGDTEGCRIAELGHLNDLKGKLVIRNLELVKSAEEAREAGLSSKLNLVKLDLQWGRVGREDGKHTLTLNGLEPHRNLQRLVIRNFPGSSYPRWLGKMEMLIKLKLVECERCRQLPALGHLPYLEHVELRGLREVQFIGDEFYGLHYSIHGSEFVFPALKTLTIINLGNLEKWEECWASENGKVFPKLENLTIRDCFELTTIPTIFPNLKYMELSRCHSVTRISESDTSQPEIVRLLDCESLLDLPVIIESKYLRWLEIRGCPRIRQVFLRWVQENLEVIIISDCNRLEFVEWHVMGHFSFLRGLKVYDCPNLRGLEIYFGRTPHLSTLWLYRCPQLRYFDASRLLTNLSELRIGPCPENLRFHLSDLFYLKTLRVLRVYGLESEFLNEPGFGYLTSLTELRLQDFESMAALPEWIGDLTSLQTLGLSNCRNLQQLPSLHAMRSLTKLQILDVYGCPLLKESCSHPEGSEWFKISHIPNIWIL